MAHVISGLGFRSTINFRISGFLDSGRLDVQMSGFPDFQISELFPGSDLKTEISGFLDFRISRFPDSGRLDVWMSSFLDFWISGFLDFQISRFLDFRISGFPDF